MGALTKIFGTHSEREIKRINPIVEKVEALRDTMMALSDEELKNRTKEYKERFAGGATLDELLPEAYATVREAARRVLGMEHYRVQIIGGIILHQGRIAEMKTGEGKTLVSTLPAYLNALEGKGVCIVTVNDYLAKRDAGWMGQVHEFLGLKVGVVLNSMNNDERRDAYNCDITYVTNNELGFDYLRDNMVIYKEQLVQRGLHYAIIDEVDSVLIDEARTPLIISGQSGKSTRLYEACDILARQMKRGEDMPEYSKMDAIMGVEQEETGDFIVNEKDKVVSLTKDGVHKVEQFFKIENLADTENLEIQHNIILALRAHNLMFRDQDYVVSDDQVMIVDEFTGRIMPGRRYSDGLHQAIEAKEHVKVKRESKTLATITFQNFFNKFEKKAGMTGTALTEEKEFRDIYGMDVVEIPTNRPVVRDDKQDVVYKTKKEKFRAVVEEVKEAYQKGQPVLVGTITIETSEVISGLLKREGIQHTVLNAKFHEMEAEIVAGAGAHGAVTIATNMAGRGTDIKLSPEVKAAGGLAIIGTARHESRRVDRQLRGRSGRQGDPGSSVFYVSFEDQLMRLFATDRVMKMLDTLGLKEGEMIESGMVTKAIENAQKRVEENNFGIRKRLLEYDDVMNKQRTYIYNRRHHALLGERIGIDIANMTYDLIENLVANYDQPTDYEELSLELMRVLTLQTPFPEEEFANMSREDKVERLYAAANETLERRSQKIIEVATPVIKEWVENRGANGRIIVPMTDGKRIFHLRADITEAYNTGCKSIVKEWHKAILLVTIDELWKEHLRELDDLRQSVQNASYEQKDPLVIYKVESFHIFEAMLNNLNQKALAALMRGQIYIPAPQPQPTPSNVSVSGAHGAPAPEAKAPEAAAQKTEAPAAPRREPQVQQAMPERPNDYSQYTASKEGLPGENAQRQAMANAGGGPRKVQPAKAAPRVGRNDPCPCGSGKKFKNCHGRGM